jgi:hypothetical protein
LFGLFDVLDTAGREDDHAAPLRELLCSLPRSYEALEEPLLSRREVY